MLLAKEGHKIVMTVLVIAVILSTLIIIFPYLFIKIIAVISVIVFLFVFWFFRDPERNTNQEPNDAGSQVSSDQKLKKKLFLESLNEKI